MFRPRLSPIPFLAALCAALAVLCVRVAIGEEAALASLPLVLLLVALVFKRYPGERLLDRLIERFSPRRRRAGSIAPPRPALRRSPRGPAGLIKARPLRGPPVPLCL